MREEKKRYSGISLGGIIKRVMIKGDKYTLVYGYDRKEDKYGYGIEKNPRFDFLRRIYFIFPFFDLGSLVGFLMIPWIMSLLSAGEGGGIPTEPLIPPFVWEILLYGLIIFLYGSLYFLIMRGVKTWHGSEHKIISAMENNDLENANTYDPIHERCGGTLLPTMFVSIFIWMIIAYHTGILIGQYTFLSFCIYLNIKVFHKYDKVGIWVGKWIQRHFTIAEPETWKMELGKKGAREFLKAENGENFIEEEYVEIGGMG